jgi:hypothetical protein
MGKTRDKVAKTVGLGSGSTYEKAAWANKDAGLFVYVETVIPADKGFHTRRLYKRNPPEKTFFECYRRWHFVTLPCIEKLPDDFPKEPGFHSVFG